VKGIGIFVAILLVGGGIAMYVFTRPPDRTLDAQGKAWVTRFTAWRNATERRTDRAYIAIGGASEREAVRRVDEIGACSTQLARLGDPPAFLDAVVQQAGSACGEIEYATSLNTGYGASSLGSTAQHLRRATQWLDAAKQELSEQLAKSRS
jgi:hypothetical protein